jgi:predicted enzyme related to lactoylglutathione lyase
MQRKMPNQPFMNYLMVASIEASCRKVEKAGGIIVLPKTEIAPNMGWIAAYQGYRGQCHGIP